MSAIKNRLNETEHYDQSTDLYPIPSVLPQSHATIRQQVVLQRYPFYYDLINTIRYLVSAANMGIVNTILCFFQEIQ